MGNDFFRKALFICALCLPQASQLQEITRWEQESMRLHDMQQLWRSQEIHDYSFLLDISCFGCFSKYPARIMIKEDKVVAVLNPDTGEPLRERTIDGTQGRSLWPEEAELFPDIDKLFDIVEGAIKDRDGSSPNYTVTSEFSVEYDETYGFPRTIHKDDSRAVSSQGRTRVSSDSSIAFRLSDFAH